METVIELQKLLAEKEPDFNSKPEFARLREFYEEMKRQGLVKKEEYSLPPLDTTGQRLFQAQQGGLQSCDNTRLAARHGFEP